MKPLLSAVLVLAAPALADGLLPVHEVRYATYDFQTQRIVPDNAGLRARQVVWECANTSGFFTGRLEQQVAMDWGDVATPSPIITELTIGYATDSSTPIRLDFILWNEENGFNSRFRTPAGVLRFRDVPGGTGGFGFYTGWVISVPLPTLKRIQFRGDDVDGDGLGDFGYSLNFRDIGDGFGGAGGHERFGPLLVTPDPNAVPSSCPGAQNVFDRFSDDPSEPPPAPNDFRNPSLMIYDGIFWFESVYAQFYLSLYTDPNLLDAGACNRPGCGGADIDPAPGLPFGGGDCVIGLADLAVLLGNFGTTAGAIYADGDVEPASTGDGDVDLGDLSVLLAEFGTDCR